MIRNDPLVRMLWATLRARVSKHSDRIPALMAMPSLPILGLLGGGLVGRFFDGLANWLQSGMESIINGLFAVSIEAMVLLDNPYESQAANEAWMNSFEVSLAIFPVMIILGLLSMPFSDEKKTSLWRQGIRIVGVIAIFAASRPLIGFAVDLSNTVTVALMPSGTEMVGMFLPDEGLLSGLAGAFSALALVLAIYFIGGIMVAAFTLVLILLQLRIFFIYIVYIASPFLAVLWYADWGLLESVNEFANKWTRMGIYTCLSGPIIAILFRTMAVIASGAVVEGTDGAADAVVALWSHLILVLTMPIVMIAAIWKIISWAGEPIGAGQALTGITMAFGAAAGALAGLGGAGAGAAGQAASSAGGAAQSAAEGMSGMGGGGGGGGGAAAGSGGGGGGPAGTGSGTGAAGTSGSGQLSEAVGQQDTTVSASGSAEGGATAEAGGGSGSSAAGASGPQAGVEGDMPGGTGGGSEGPADEVTGAGDGGASAEGEPQGYINAAKERYGNFKERNKQAMQEAVGTYKEQAKDKLNPTNISRKKAESKRAEAENVAQRQEQFNDAVDMEAGENGQIDLAQAEKAGALNHSPKATGPEGEGDTTASLNEDGTFEYETEDGEMATESVGAKNQQFRNKQQELHDEAAQHEERADQIDQAVSERAGRLKKTGQNISDKYGPRVNQAANRFGQEALRGTIGAHSPYLMAGDNTGIFQSDSGGGGQGAGRGTRGQQQQANTGQEQAAESGGRPEVGISADQATEHEDLITENNERFDLNDQEYGFEPGGGQTPDGVSQQGYLVDSEGNRKAPVEVAEDSDVSLSSDESVKLGNVGMTKRDGDSAQSLPDEDGEYGAITVDENSRTFDENEVRADEIIGNDEMTGQEAQLKDATIREAPGESESYEGQYYAEAQNGERVPINAEDEEADEALGSLVGEQADLQGTVQNEYGMSEDTHAGYEGAHEYNAMNISLGDEGEGEEAGESAPEDGSSGGSGVTESTGDGTGGNSGGSDGSFGEDSEGWGLYEGAGMPGNDDEGTSTEDGEGNVAESAEPAVSEANNEAATATANAGGTEGEESSGTHSIEASGGLGSSSGSGSSSGGSGSGSSGGSASDGSSSHQVSAASGSTTGSESGSESGSAGGESSETMMSAEEMVENGGTGPDRVSSDDKFVVESSATDSDKHANAYKFRKLDENGNRTDTVVPVTRMGREAGPPELDEAEDPPAVQDEHGNDLGRRDPQEGEVVTDVSGFKFDSYGEDWHGAHEGIEADDYGGADGQYSELRPDEESSLTVLGEDSGGSDSAPDTNDHASGETGSGSSTSANEAGASIDAESGSEGSQSVSNESSSSGEASAVESQPTEAVESGETSTSEHRSSESASDAATESAPDYGGEVQVTEDNQLPTEDIEGVDELEGERVDATGEAQSDLLADANLGSGDRNDDAMVKLADDTNDQISKFGNGKLEDVEEGDGVAIENAKVDSMSGEEDGQFLRLDEESEVETMDNHEGPATVSVGHERSSVQEESSEQTTENAAESSIESAETESGPEEAEPSTGGEHFQPESEGIESTPTEEVEAAETGSSSEEAGEVSPEASHESETITSAETEPVAGESAAAEHTTEDASEDVTEEVGGDVTETVETSPEIEEQSETEVEVDDSTETTEHHTDEEISELEISEEGGGGGESGSSHSSGVSESHSGESTHTVEHASSSSSETENADSVGLESSGVDEQDEREETEGVTDHSEATSQQIETGDAHEEVEQTDSESGGDASSESEREDGDSETGESAASHSGEGGGEQDPLTPGSDEVAAGDTSGSDVEGESEDWEEYAQNWREHAVESEEADAIEDEMHGYREDSMHVEELENGEKVFVTNYDELPEESDHATEQKAEELKHQSLVGHEFTDAMGHETPEVAFNEEENEVIQQEAGGADTETWAVEDAPDEVLEKVDRDEYEEKMATQLLGGNFDTDVDNVHVDEEGGLHVIDYDRTAGFIGDVGGPDEMESNAGTGAKTGRAIGKANDDFHTDKGQYKEELTARAVEIANDLHENDEIDEVLEPVEQVDEEMTGPTEDKAPVIRSNIEDVADGEFETDHSDEASQDDIEDALADIDLDGESGEE